MEDFKCSGEDTILMLDSLSRLIKEADTLDMNEGKIIVCLPHMWTITATREYRSSASVNRTDGLEYWPEAV